MKIALTMNEYQDQSVHSHSLIRHFVGHLYVRLSLLTMTNPNQLCDVLLSVCSKMADETNLSSKLPVADRTREI